MMDSELFLIALGLFVLMIGFAVGFWTATHYKLNKFSDRMKDMEDYYLNKGKYKKQE